MSVVRLIWEGDEEDKEEGGKHMRVAYCVRYRNV